VSSFSGYENTQTDEDSNGISNNDISLTSLSNQHNDGRQDEFDEDRDASDIDICDTNNSLTSLSNQHDDSSQAGRDEDICDICAI
jgi:hypothetical protein